MTDTLTKKQRASLLERLAELGGGAFKASDIHFDGTRLTVPEGMSVKRAIRTLEAHDASQETQYAFSRTFRYRPHDGAVAFQRALVKLTGFAGRGVPIKTLFGTNPPEEIMIPVGVDETISVPWGQIEIALFDDAIAETSSSFDQEYGQLFRLIVNARKKFGPQINGLFQMIEDELETASIYRGKALDGGLGFVDLSGVDPTKVFYADEVATQLEANVWSSLRHSDVMRKANVPLKRAVLLHGPYGTGKTLAAFITAQIAIDNGWSFVYCRPGKDDIAEVMMTARLYQPAVVFFEDVDTVAEGTEESNRAVSHMLDLFDGIQAKGTDLMVVLTTNHPENIHRGMVRPGRLDAIIEIAALDRGSIEDFIRSLTPKREADRLDYDRIAVAMDGFLPAFIRETIDRAKRYAVARSGKTTGLTTEDFVASADGLRPQFDLMHAPPPEQGIPAIDAQIHRLVQSATAPAVAYAKDAAAQANGAKRTANSIYEKQEENDEQTHEGLYKAKSERNEMREQLESLLSRSRR